MCVNGVYEPTNITGGPCIKSHKIVMKSPEAFSKFSAAGPRILKESFLRFGCFGAGGTGNQRREFQAKHATATCQTGDFFTQTEQC